MEETHPNTSVQFPNTHCQFAIKESVRKSQVDSDCTRAKADLIAKAEVND